MSEYFIEDTGNGTYTLNVGQAEVAKIKWLHGERVIQMLTVGPVGFDMAVTIMKVYAHMVALLGQEKGNFNPPKSEVVETMKLESKHGKYQERPTSPRVSENSIVKGLRSRDQGSSQSGKSGRSRARSRR